MIRAVLDTNVLVSAFIRQVGKPARLLARASIDFEWLTSEYILAELATVLTRRHIRSKYPAHTTPTLIGTYLARIRETATVVEMSSDLRGVTRDPKDDRVLACALDGKAEYLVTGDEHLLSLFSFQAILIVTPDRFVVLLDSAQPR